VSIPSSGAAVQIREMGLADIPAGLALCRASGWNQTEHDWRHFLTTAPHGALVAVEHGQVIGTVATLPYGPFAWISMVLVDPAARRRGVGTLLLERGLALIPDPIVARLDATPAGEPLYRKLGFLGEYRLARWFLDVDTRGASSATAARPLTSADLRAVHDIDARVFGASRATLLERLAAEAPEYAWAVERDGRLQGYLLGRHGHVREQLGPLVAESADVAERLLDACLAANPQRAVFLDAPDDQQAWTAALASRGFAIERPFLRMYRGQLTTPGEPSRVYAITGPEFG
jgi:ribosomal protein S18 acetylase RimI-like enzyme